MLAVPADATRQGTSTGTTGIADIEVALNGPVMGYIKTAPFTIVEICLCHDDGVTKEKAPVLIKTLSVAC